MLVWVNVFQVLKVVHNLKGEQKNHKLKLNLQSYTISKTEIVFVAIIYLL